MVKNERFLILHQCGCYLISTYTGNIATEFNLFQVFFRVVKLLRPDNP
jgi:hypothetical protein